MCFSVVSSVLVCFGCFQVDRLLPALVFGLVCCFECSCGGFHSNDVQAREFYMSWCERSRKAQKSQIQHDNWAECLCRLFLMFFFFFSRFILLVPFGPLLAYFFDLCVPWGFPAPPPGLSARFSVVLGALLVSCWSGAEWSGVERSGAEWSGVERSREE